MDNNKQNIKSSIINVSFPRSGHRFLRNILLAYFGSDLIFYESYSKTLLNNNPNLSWTDANYIKTHDFDLMGKSILMDKFPINRKYLIQIRKPLDSIISWYEFSLRTQEGIVDSKANWLIFLESKLIYWKKFYDLWIKPQTNDSCLVLYDDLHSFTLKTVTRVIQFIDNQYDLHLPKLDAMIKNTDFLQYVSDIDSKKTQIRKIEEFKYYDKNKFMKINQEIEKYYPI